MARIPYFDPEQAEGRAKDAYAKLPKLNIFRMLGHSGDLMDSFVRLGNSILYRARLDPILREIAILRVGVLCGADYEVFQHTRIAKSLGLDDAKIAAIHDGPEASAFTELERLVMAFTDDQVRHARASDQVFDPLAQHFSHREMQELVLTIGYYMMVSHFLETFEVEIEPATASG